MSKFPGQVCCFLQRHKRKCIFAGVLVGGIIGTVKYAQYKLQEWVAQEERKYIEELRKRQHFEKTKEHCFAIAKAVVVSLQESITDLLNTAIITEAIKSERAAENKLKLWNDLKITIFTKIASSLYIVSVVTGILCVKLSHVSAKVYLKAKTEGCCGQSADEHIQQWYLNLSHEFLTQSGLAFIVQEFRTIVSDLTDSMPLQCKMSGTSVESLMKSMHDRIQTHKKLNLRVNDSDSGCSMLSYLVPSVTYIQYQNEEDVGVKRKLVYEMWDLLDSEDFMTVMKSCVLASFRTFAHCIDSEVSSVQGLGGNAIVALGKLTVRRDQTDFNSLPLAKLLPLLSANIDKIYSESFIRAIIGNIMLSQFSMNVYESFMQTLSE